MISVYTRRAGLICLAANVDGLRVITMTWGLTQEGATRRLIRRLDRQEGQHV